MMDGWLKALIATACVVVIVGGGYYAWSENAESKERASARERRAAYSDCQRRMDEISKGRLSGDDQMVISNCILNGHVGESDITKVSEERRRRLGG